MGSDKSPPSTERRQENTSPNRSPRDNVSPREKISPRGDLKSPRDQIVSPRDIKKSPRDPIKSPRDMDRSPRDQIGSSTDMKKSPRDPIKSPRDMNATAPAGNSHTTSDPSSEVNASSTTKPTSLMSSLRNAHLRIEREDSIDFADAVIEKATREHHALQLPRSGDSSPIAQRLKDINDDKNTLENDMKKNLAATMRPIPSTTGDAENAKFNKNATVAGVVSTGDDDDGPKLQPKHSEDIPLDNDVDALLGLVKASKKKKPISDKYLKMLERNKTSTSQHAPSRRKTKYNITSEASRISQLLANGDDSRWANPRNSAVQFKSHYEERMFRSMQKVLVNQNKNKKKHKSEAKGSSAGKRNTFDRLSKVKKQDESLFYIQNESGRKYASFNDAKNCTFMPKTNESKRKSKAADNNGSDDEAKESRDHNFLLRQEANERKRVMEREFQKGKQDYDALVDKKICPVCKSTQSYDEVKEKRKNCPNCQVAYTFRTNWGNVQHGFYKRQNDAYVNGIRALDQKKQEVFAAERKTSRVHVDSVTGEMFSVEDDHQDLIWTKDMEMDFFSRMEESKMKKEVKMKELEEEVYGSSSRGRKTAARREYGDSEFDTSLYYN